MITDALDSASLSEVLDHGARNGAVDLVLVAKNAAGDAQNLRDLGSNLGPLLLVKVDVVVKLILYLYLGP